MIYPEIPENENERLKDLEEIGILDSDQENDYDNLTALASAMFDVPIALVSIVDSDRQWFKSSIGVGDVKETPRDISFCGHAINSPDEAFIISDARMDVRFADNPLVTGPTKIVFYAGIPLKSLKGNALGTLCLIDQKPRIFSLKEKNTLKALANQVSRLIDLRHKNKQLDQNLNEKTILLKEIHHRVKNNLQLVSSLLNIQANSLNSDEFSAAIAQSQNRIKSIAIAHEKLYQSESLSKIDLQEYLNTLIGERVKEMHHIGVTSDIKVPPVNFNIEQVLPIGLIITEMVTNSLKYAISDKQTCTLSLKIECIKDNRYVLLYNDNGPGLGSNFDKDNLTSIGMMLIDSFVHQLDGTLEQKSTTKGLFYRLEFAV